MKKSISISASPLREKPKGEIKAKALAAFSFLFFYFSFLIGGLAQCPTGVNASASSNPICQGDSAQLVAQIIDNFCNDYSISNVPFAPVAGSGTNVFLTDDQLSNALPIGFNFYFYCNSYSTFYISSNGFLSFDPFAGNGCCTGQLLPNPNSPNNLIAFAWNDLDPSTGGTIDYFTTGTAPNRKLVVNFINVPHFSGGNNVTAQVILYETSNIIEIHTDTMPSDGGPHTMGLEDSSGVAAHPVAGRNSVSWTAFNEGMQFIPGTIFPGTLTYTWSPSSGLSNPNTSNPQAFPSQTTAYIVTVSSASCTPVSDTLTISVDTVTISVNVLTPDTAICTGSVSISTSSTGAASYNWVPAIGLSCTNCSNPVATPTITTTYHVTAFTSLGGCSASDSIIITVSNLAQLSAMASDSGICLGDSVQLNVSGTLSAAGILITECDLGANDYIEIQNVSSSAINTTGWVVAISNSYTDINTVNTIYWNLPSSIPAGQILWKTDLATSSNYWGNNIFWNPGSFPTFTGWVILLDNTGTVRDFAVWNWPSSNI